MAFDYTYIEDGYLFKNITDTTVATALVKTGAGLLRAIVVNSTAAGAMPVYNGLTGTTGTPTIATLKASIVEGTYVYNTAFTTGLYVRPAGAGNYTIIYR